MQRVRLPIRFLSIFVLASGMGAAQTPSFTISASNAIMPPDVTTCSLGVCSMHLGGSTATLTSLSGYAGSVLIRCGPANAQPGGNLPYCILVGPGEVSLAANQKITVPLNLSWQPIPAAVTHPLHHGNGGKPAWPALAGVLLFGLGFRRRAARPLLLLVFAFGTLAAMASISACSAGHNPATSKSYTYQVTATEYPSLSASASTTFVLTIPYAPQNP